MKKSVLNTLLQAVKAIKGGVIAIKGQLIKGGGKLVSASGKLVSSQGDAITKLGKTIATNAILVPYHSSSSNKGHYHEGKNISFISGIFSFIKFHKINQNKFIFLISAEYIQIFSISKLLYLFNKLLEYEVENHYPGPSHEDIYHNGPSGSSLDYHVTEDHPHHHDEGKVFK